MKMISTACVWFRNDLRLDDNPAIFEASKTTLPLLFIYILDDTSDPKMGAAQKWWLHHSLAALRSRLAKRNLTFLLLNGEPHLIFKKLTQQFDIRSIYWNNCYEPSSLKRDTLIESQFREKAIPVYRFDSTLLQVPWEGLNQKKQPYLVFTHYWKNFLKQNITRSCFPAAHFKIQHQLSINNNESEALETWALLPKTPNWASAFAEGWTPGEKGASQKLNQFVEYYLNNYRSARDKPNELGTSRLSPHLHFGEITSWQIWHTVQEMIHLNAQLIQEGEAFLRQLVWRDFSYHLLYHFPDFPDKNFKKSFDRFAWENNTTALQAWQQGRTGFPIVDAGMRELWKTGYMHNRVRMIVASFLVKDLLIHWKEGEKWFWDTLLDADLANNSVSWQWVAGSGVDSAPYFRVFNPIVQGEKFDPEGEYVRKWIPELAELPNAYIHHPWDAPPLVLKEINLNLGQDYPLPIVDHAFARLRALDLYKKIL